jgi:hypothetical protein
VVSDLYLNMGPNVSYTLDRLRGIGAGNERNIALWAAAEIERLRAALLVVDDDVRHHLRNDEIAPVLLRPHAIREVRAALGIVEQQPASA